MKFSPVLALVLAGVATVMCPRATAQVQDAITHEDLIDKRKQAIANNPLRNAKQSLPEGSVDPTKVNQPESIIATSDFLSFQGLSTLVPKRSILTIPKNFAGRIKFEPGSKLVTWADFYPANRGWIKTIEVTRRQAEGNEPFPEAVLEGIQKSSIVVVATYKGGPISVLPQKEPAKEETPK